MQNFKKTKIICTLGPATDSEETLLELIKHGLDVCRFNFSHGSYEEHSARMSLARKCSKLGEKDVAILLDTKGPEIRTGKFSTPTVELKIGQTFTLKSTEILGDDTACSISYTDLYKDVKTGDRILIDDGLIELVVLQIKGTDIITEVKNAGIVKNNKGINVPNVKINLPALTNKDIEDIKFGITQDIDFIAASFVRKASDVTSIREILDSNNASHIQIISKIENQEGLDNLDAIIEVSDGIMIARGDLGVEIPAEEVPIVQKMIIDKCNRAGKVVITATQMLDSMMRNPRPTRAEVSDVANAIYNGTDAIMLSGETAAGLYPIESLKTMASIAMKIEQTLDYQSILQNKKILSKIPSNAIAHAACLLAQDLNANAIIAATTSGYTARLISHFRPSSRIIATTDSIRVKRALMLVFGVYPLLTEQVGSIDDMIAASIDAVKQKGYLDAGDTAIIAAGVPVGISGSTNLIKVHKI